jgi:hypothetical protein
MRNLADMLADLQYTPRHDVVETKRLRSQYAGNPQMQQELAVEDRYHQGKGMMQESPIAALGALLGSVPYDAAKLAYFKGPRPVKQVLGSLSERLFPGEGFNDQTTSRPDINQYRGLISGMLAGWKP